MVSSCRIFENKPKPTWESTHFGRFDFEVDNSVHWQQALDDSGIDARTTTINHDWNLWCNTLKGLHNPQGSLVGGKPTFRIRDFSAKINSLHDSAEPFM